MWGSCDYSISLAFERGYTIRCLMVTVYIYPLLGTHGNILVQPLAEPAFDYMRFLNTETLTTSYDRTGIVQLKNVFHRYGKILGPFLQNGQKTLFSFFGYKIFQICEKFVVVHVPNILRISFLIGWLKVGLSLQPIKHNRKKDRFQIDKTLLTFTLFQWNKSMGIKKKIAVLTGAGVSAESGINTFRDAGGLWEGHDVMEVASPQGFATNPALVLDFYNQRRKRLKEVAPNRAHFALAELEVYYDVTIITQNVDDLHERAGSTNVIHLHGELLKIRSSGNDRSILDCEEDINLGDLCEQGYQLRPHIVWFGEAVPLLEKAAAVTQLADIVIIIGTSMQVYPAAGLVDYAHEGAPIYFIDPKPSVSKYDFDNLTIIPKTAVKGVPPLVSDLIDKSQ